MEHIKSQLKEGCLDFMGCMALINSIFDVVANVHDRMKATERRKETMAKWEDCKAEMEEAGGKEERDRACAICKALELLLDRVHKIRVDTANNKLQAMAPVIRQHGVEYEKSHFAKKLASGAIGMDRTIKWIRHTSEHLQQLQNKSLVDITRPKQTASLVPLDLSAKYESIMILAQVDLLADFPNWGGERREGARKNEVPETMMLDLLRIKALGALFHTEVLSAIIMTQISQVTLPLCRLAGLARCAALTCLPHPGDRLPEVPQEGGGRPQEGSSQALRSPYCHRNSHE